MNAAIETAVETHLLLSEYQSAIRSPRTGNLYEQVLIACALAVKDNLGYFTASAVRQPLSSIMGKRYEIPAFARHLKRFSEPFGGVLVKSGEPRRFVYRFINPLLQPFAILAGISKELVSEDTINVSEESPTPSTNEQPPLF